MLNGLDLFSGIGGISLALRPWVRTIAYCENERYCQGVLLSRMREGSLDRAPIWDDVQTLQRASIKAEIDIIYGGFPCQDISVAGTGRGLEGERSGLFFEIIRLCREIRPRFVFLENVPAITVRGGVRVAESFAEIRYDCRWGIVSAAEMGAPHRRERWFLLAQSNGERGGPEPIGVSGIKNSSLARNDGEKESMADRDREGLERPGACGFQEKNTIFECRSGLENPQRIGLEEPFKRPRSEKGEWTASEPFSPGWWESEPDVGRVVTGLPMRVDRIKALGNSVVPAQAREAFKRLSGIT